MQQARLRFEDYALEWLAEVQYVHKAVAMVESPDGDGGGKALVSPQPKEALLARLESRGHEFHLLQSITTAAELQPWKPPAVARAILEQHEFIDQVLDANGVGPLLCKLPKHERLVSANKLGELLTKYVPDSEFDNVASGRTLFAQVVPPQVRGLLSDAVSELAHLVPQGVLIDCRSGRAAPHSALVSA